MKTVSKKQNGIKRQTEGALIWKRFRQNNGAMFSLCIIAILAVLALLAPVLVDYEVDVCETNVMNRFATPSSEHWFGTDELGRDIFSRILYGSRFSLSVGLVATVIGLLVGSTLGAIGGYFGGTIENIIMRLMDIMSAVPNILMGILITSVLGANTINLMIAVGVASVPNFARVTRAAVMRVRDSDYVEACRAIGDSEAKIIVQHILPNCLSPILVQASLRMGSAVIAASSLSFLGLGVQLPAPEWGAMLSTGRKYIRQAPHLTVFPGLCIMLVVLCLNMIGDGLRDAFDPKLRR